MDEIGRLWGVVDAHVRAAEENVVVGEDGVQWLSDPQKAVWLL